MTNDEQRRAFLETLGTFYGAIDAAPAHRADDVLAKTLALAGVRLGQAIGEAFFDMAKAQQDMAAFLEQIEMNTRAR